MKLLLIVMILVLGQSFFFTCQVSGQQRITGFVFDDTNQNGIKDKHEPGIEDVCVTNGREVVQTDYKGKYQLPASDDMIVSVIKPSNYRVPVNEWNQPQFFYIHKPGGSPPNKYAGVAPTGPLPASIDFPLVPQKEDINFDVLLFGDPQPNTKEDVGYFAKAIVSEVRGIENIPFGLSLGDLVGDDLDLFRPYIKAVSRVGIPWYNAYGNHDMNRGITDDKMADETFEAHFGPANYSFNYGNAHFIVLDDVLYPDPRDGDGYYGGFREDILDFVANDLRFVPKDKLVVISFHIPIYETSGDRFRDADRRKLFDLLKDFPYTLTLSAHTHGQNHYFFTDKEGWRRDKPHHHYNVGTTAGDVYKGPKDRYGTPASYQRDGTPKGYAFLRIKNNRYEYDYKISGQSPDYRMSIHIPKIVPQAEKYRGEIVVNFFQGSPKDTLEYRVDHGEWQLLEHTRRLDKYLLDLEYEWDHAEELPWGIRLSNPIPSSHIWSTRMPSHFDIGDHVLEVRAKDWLGRVYTAKKKFRIVPDH